MPIRRGAPRLHCAGGGAGGVGSYQQTLRTAEQLNKLGKRSVELGLGPAYFHNHAAEFGARFYGLPENRDTITLVREEWRVPERLRFGDDELVPLRAGETIPWKLV